jgi:hypothetical protein
MCDGMNISLADLIHFAYIHFNILVAIFCFSHNRLCGLAEREKHQLNDLPMEKDLGQQPID